jgi:hypothetical protein
MSFGKGPMKKATDGYIYRLLEYEDLRARGGLLTFDSWPRQYRCQRWYNLFVVLFKDPSIASCQLLAFFQSSLPYFSLNSKIAG